jgi:hypothetical protein
MAVLEITMVWLPDTGHKVQELLFVICLQ